MSWISYSLKLQISICQASSSNEKYYYSNLIFSSAAQCNRHLDPLTNYRLRLKRIPFSIASSELLNNGEMKDAFYHFVDQIGKERVQSLTSERHCPIAARVLTAIRPFFSIFRLTLSISHTTSPFLIARKQVESRRNSRRISLVKKGRGLSSPFSPLSTSLSISLCCRCILNFSAFRAYPFPKTGKIDTVKVL